MRLIASTCFITLLTAMQVAAEINETTSSYLRNDYMCRVATENGLKPVPAGLDHFRMSGGHYGVADLYGDGAIDFFFGFSDDTFDLDRLGRANETRDEPWPLDMFFDNAERSNQNHQYSFYSPDPDFIVPGNTRFLVARTFAVQDFNGDGIDDFAVAHFGRDYPPFDGRQNELFLSGEGGYEFSLLAGGQGQNHGATAGDIDEDGDVDLIISRLEPATLLFFENDGRGRFSLRHADGIPRRSHEIDFITVALWDVDNDGHLDLVTSRRSDPFDGGIAMVFWGRPGFAFEETPLRITTDDLEDSGEVIMRNGFPMETAPGVLDFEFGDFDGDGNTDVAMVSQSDFYRRWQLTIASFEDRSVSARVVDRSAVNANFFVFGINACDLHDDGTDDLVYEHFGQHFYSVWGRDAGSNTSRMERYVWLNDGTGTFDRYLLESPVYFSSGYREYLSANAEWLGVASEGYLPAQTYFPNVLDDRERYFHPFYELDLPHQDVPFIMVPEITDRFPGLPFMRPTGSVAQQNDPSQISPHVAAIIEAIRRGDDPNAALADTTSPNPTTAPASPPHTSAVPPATPSTVSPRAQAVIDAIRRGEDPRAALADTPVRAAPALNQPSVAQPNDPSQISDRVRAIIESRQSD